MSLPPSSEDALRALISHTVSNSPYYRRKKWAEELRSGNYLSFSEIPATSKQEFKEHTSDFYCDVDVKQHGKIIDRYTSGSTGEPVLIKKTEYSNMQNSRHNLDLQKMWNLDEHTVRLTINFPTEELTAGHAEVSHSENIKSITYYDYRPEKMLDFIKKIKPSFLTTVPSLITAILDLYGELFSISHIATVGESISEDFLRKISGLKNVRHMDVYGSTETGLIAIKCPDCEKYHYNHNNCIVEFEKEEIEYSNDNARSIVLTPLHNFATPLIRYKIGDIVVLLTKMTECPNGELAFDRVIGRELELFKTRDGRKIVPIFLHEQVFKMGIKKLKLVQVDYDHVEMHYIPSGERVLSQEEAQEILSTRMGDLFKASPVRVDHLPPSKGGKYLMHECRI